MAQANSQKQSPPPHTGNANTIQYKQHKRAAVSSLGTSNPNANKQYSQQVVQTYLRNTELPSQKTPKQQPFHHNP